MCVYIYIYIYGERARKRERERREREREIHQKHQIHCVHHATDICTGHRCPAYIIITIVLVSIYIYIYIYVNHNDNSYSKYKYPATTQGTDCRPKRKQEIVYTTKLNEYYTNTNTQTIR